MKVQGSSSPQKGGRAGGRGPAAPPRSEGKPLKAPLSVRFVSWLLLAAWLAWLAYRLLDPMPFLFPAPVTGAAAARRGSPSPMTETPVELALEPATDPPEAPEPPELTALKQEVTERLLAGEFSSALALVNCRQNQPDTYTGQAELAQFVRDISRIDLLVQEGLRSQIDRRIRIRVQNRLLTVVPRAMAGNRINAVFLDRSGKEGPRSVTFRIADLDPAERAHWLGEADTPDKCAMKYLLYMRSGDTETARVFASGSGPLAGAFLARTERPASGGSPEA